MFVTYHILRHTIGCRIGPSVANSQVVPGCNRSLHHTGSAKYCCSRSPGNGYRAVGMQSSCVSKHAKLFEEVMLCLMMIYFTCNLVDIDCYHTRLAGHSRRMLVAACKHHAAGIHYCYCNQSAVAVHYTLASTDRPEPTIDAHSSMDDCCNGCYMKRDYDD